MQLDNADENQKGAETTLVAHGDGSYHTQSGYSSGSRKEHKSIGAALMHLAARHATGDHIHVASDDDGYTVHHVREGGKVKGPHNPKTIRDLKRAMAKFLDEEGAEEG